MTAVIEPPAAAPATPMGFGRMVRKRSRAACWLG